VEDAVAARDDGSREEAAIVDVHAQRVLDGELVLGRQHVPARFGVGTRGQQEGGGEGEPSHAWGWGTIRAVAGSEARPDADVDAPVAAASAARSADLHGTHHGWPHAADLGAAQPGARRIEVQDIAA
jgi:hypothetical protein